MGNVKIGHRVCWKNKKHIHCSLTNWSKFSTTFHLSMSSCCSLRCHHSPPSSCEKRLPKIIFRNMQPSEILLFHTKRFHNFWLIWSPTHAMIIIILDRQHMSWSYSLLIANICHDHNHYRSPTHAMIIIFLTHKIFSQFSSTGLLSCYTQFLTNKVFLFSLMLSVTWWTLLCKSLCQDDH